MHVSITSAPQTTGVGLGVLMTPSGVSKIRCGVDHKRSTNELLFRDVSTVAGFNNRCWRHNVFAHSGFTEKADRDEAAAVSIYSAAAYPVPDDDENQFVEDEHQEEGVVFRAKPGYSLLLCSEKHQMSCFLRKHTFQCVFMHCIIASTLRGYSRTLKFLVRGFAFTHRAVCHTTCCAKLTVAATRH
eukprot:3048038-Amphidinium_carterae.1